MGAHIFLKKVIYKLNSPPPWIFFSKNKIFKRIKLKRSFFFIGLEIIQFIFSGLISLTKIGYFFKYRSIFSLEIFLKGCFFNCFSINEIKILSKLGFRSWSELSEFYPESQTFYRHQENRQNWPNQSKDEIRKLGDKIEILKLAPKEFTKPFITEEDQGIIPEWWQKELCCEGIIVKPIYGSKGDYILKFWIEDLYLMFQKLHIKDPNKVNKQKIKDLSPKVIFEIWRAFFNKNEKIFAMPYFLNSKNLFNATPSVVIRVITEKKLSDNNLSIMNNWMEYNIGNKMILQNDKGIKLITSRNEILVNLLPQSENLYFEKFFKECSSASKVMHERLINIDRIAWDWIPGDNGPMLLEGNACFGLFIPQIFCQIERRYFKKNF